jgi:hypothetical protein
MPRVPRRRGWAVVLLSGLCGAAAGWACTTVPVDLRLCGCVAKGLVEHGC